MKFINLKKNTTYFDLVKEAFKNLIEPKYGPQEKALNKVLAGIDRNCEIMFINNEPKGLIIYKIFLQNEFGMSDAFELKTAILFDRSIDKGLGELLFKRAEYHAKKLNAKYIYFTLSEKNPELFNHFKHLEWKSLGKSKSGDNSFGIHILYKKLSRK